MQIVQPIENVKFAEDKFVVTIHPNVDYAFVVALIATIDAMKSWGLKEKVAVQAIKQGGEVLANVIVEAATTVVSSIFA